MTIARTLIVLGTSLIVLAAAWPAPAQAARDAPEAPSALFGVVLPDDLILLVWAPPVEGGVKAGLTYRVYRSVDDGPFVRMTETSTTLFPDHARSGQLITYGVTTVTPEGGESTPRYLEINGGGDKCVRTSSRSVALYVNDCVDR